MNRSLEKAAPNSGLVATGSSRLWDIAIDESLERENEWTAEIEGPQVYLVFQLRDRDVISESLEFLQARTRANGQPHRQAAGPDTLTLGKFGAASVSLMWDDEGFPRCFIVIGPKAKSTFRLTLHEDDIQMLVGALREVIRDFSPHPQDK